MTEKERGQFLYISARANQVLNAPKAAIRAWNELLALPEDAVPPERRAEAQQQLVILSTLSPSATP